MVGETEFQEHCGGCLYTEFGKIGIVVCFDRHYPERIRTETLQGANLILITRWPMSTTSTGGGDLVPLTGWSIYLHPRQKPDDGKCRSIFHHRAYN